MSTDVSLQFYQPFLHVTVFLAALIVPENYLCESEFVLSSKRNRPHWLLSDSWLGSLASRWYRVPVSPAGSVTSSACGARQHRGQRPCATQHHGQRSQHRGRRPWPCECIVVPLGFLILVFQCNTSLETVAVCSWSGDASGVRRTVQNRVGTRWLGPTGTTRIAEIPVKLPKFNRQGSISPWFCLRNS